MMSQINKKRILVTGAHGFVGKNLLQKLRQNGFENTLVPTRQECDFSNQFQVDDYFKSQRPEIVFHLAGKNGGIGINKQKIADFFYENTLINTFVIHYSHLYGVEKLVSLGAGCAYPKHSPIPLKESDYWNGFPDENLYGYSIAKKNLIVQSLAYKEQYGLNSTVLLPANLYGPHDNFNSNSSVIPALIEKFIQAKKNSSKSIEVWGTGNASREFLFVDDVVDALINSINCNEVGPFNLGNGIEVSIKTLVENISELICYTGNIIWDKTKADGQPRRVYDMSKFEEIFGYVPQISLNEGLEKTIKWYLENNKNKK